MDRRKSKCLIYCQVFEKYVERLNRSHINVLTTITTSKFTEIKVLYKTVHWVKSPTLPVIFVVKVPLWMSNVTEVRKTEHFEK
jgi:hypothetical protein